MLLGRKTTTTKLCSAAENPAFEDSLGSDNENGNYCT